MSHMVSFMVVSSVFAKLFLYDCFQLPYNAVRYNSVLFVQRMKFMYTAPDIQKKVVNHLSRMKEGELVTVKACCEEYKDFSEKERERIKGTITGVLSTLTNGGFLIPEKPGRRFNRIISKEFVLLIKANKVFSFLELWSKLGSKKVKPSFKTNKSNTLQSYYRFYEIEYREWLQRVNIDQDALTKNRSNLLPPKIKDKSIQDLSKTVEEAQSTEEVQELPESVGDITGVKDSLTQKQASVFDVFTVEELKDLPVEQRAKMIEILG